MKFQVKKCKEELEKAEPEKVIFLSLTQEGDKCILAAEDERGSQKTLIVFEGGCFYRWNCAYLQGLTCDIDGKILEKGVKD